MEKDDFSDAISLGIELDRALEVDPLTRRRWASMAELTILNLMFNCLPEDEQFFVDENGNTIKRVVLTEPFIKSKGEVTLDRIQTPDGQRRTVIDMSEKGWGKYAIDSATGKHTYFKNGVEKRASHRRRKNLERKLRRLDFKYDDPFSSKSQS